MIYLYHILEYLVVRKSSSSAPSHHTNSTVTLPLLGSLHLSSHRLYRSRTRSNLLFHPQPSLNFLPSNRTQRTVTPILLTAA